tara:strand:+ start:264 stop:1589 length:1326 start_codon:yes stop_codon:yes gene_type:complete
MLANLRDGLQSAIKKFVGSQTLDESTIKEFMKDLQRSLLQADVNVKLVLDLTKKIELRALKEEIPAGIPKRDHIVKILYEELSEMLGSKNKFNLKKDKENIILVLGIQGSGKTTSIGKLARYFSKNKHSVGVIAADTFRPGALAQIKTICEPFNIEIFGKEEEKKAGKIIKNGIEFFKKSSKDVIIIDTSGRHKEEKALLDEIKQLSNEIKPDHIFLVIDSTIGQQSESQARAFTEVAPIGGIILTKLDGAAKGGGAIIAVTNTKSSIFFIGTGERIDDLEEFVATRFVGRLIGMGDIQTLLQRVKEVQEEGQDIKMQRIMSGKMTINDLYEQLEQINKMGSLKKIMELIPGMSGQVKEKDIENIEENMEKWKFIIQSMTNKEKQDPDLMNSSRIKRISKGSGRNEKEIKELLNRYKQSKQMMKASKGRGMRQLMKRFGSN